jgi:hypothetical protein
MLAVVTARGYLAEPVPLGGRRPVRVRLLSDMTTGDVPQVPYRKELRGTRLAVLAYTSVDGSYVNDRYPVTTEESVPAGEWDVGPSEQQQWLHQPRQWGYRSVHVDIPVETRTIGQAWRVFGEAEKRATANERSALWSSLTRVYPELQDWVARRGHAGAAPWSGAASVAQIRAVSAQADVTVVQLHAGFQFQRASGEAAREMAHAAIDAGADIVIGHHPHTTQGLEWYKGKLIAYSLGNFVFEQDFLATLPTFFLRTVWERDQLVQARLVPLEIDRYRPVPVMGPTARRTLLGAWADSLLQAQSVRTAEGKVLTVPKRRDANSRPAQLTLDHDTALVGADPPPVRRISLTIAPRSQVPLDPTSLIDPRTAAPDVEVGRDLFGWGHFEDDTADGATGDATHWTLRSSGRVLPDASPTGDGSLQITAARGRKLATVGPVARIPLPAHRLTTAEASPLDPPATYSVQAMVRMSSGAKPFLRFSVYHFDDTDPTEDPVSALLTSVVKPLTVPADNTWHHVSVEITPEELGTSANMVLLHAGLTGDTASDRFELDDLVFVEWRRTAGMPREWGSYQFVPVPPPRCRGR